MKGVILHSKISKIYCYKKISESLILYKNTWLISSADSKNWLNYVMYCVALLQKLRTKSALKSKVLSRKLLMIDRHSKLLLLLKSFTTLKLHRIYSLRNSLVLSVKVLSIALQILLLMLGSRKFFSRKC